MRTTNRLLVLIALLLFAHLVKDTTTPAIAGDKMVIASIDKPVNVRVVAVDRRVGVEWDALKCGGTSEWSND